MSNALVDVRTADDGSVVVQPHQVVGAECAVELRQLLVHVVRRQRPRRLVIDLGDVRGVDSINLGTIAAICDLGGDYQVDVRVVGAAESIAAQLLDAGVAPRHLWAAPSLTLR